LVLVLAMQGAREPRDLARQMAPRAKRTGMTMGMMTPQQGLLTSFPAQFERGLENTLKWMTKIARRRRAHANAENGPYRNAACRTLLAPCQLSLIRGMVVMVTQWILPKVPWVSLGLDFCRVLTPGATCNATLDCIPIPLGQG